VTNITGKAQLECAEMNVSVGCTIDSMVLYIGAEPRAMTVIGKILRREPSGLKDSTQRRAENNRIP
jgi:hypothetical protein